MSISGKVALDYRKPEQGHRPRHRATAGKRRSGHRRCGKNKQKKKAQAVADEIWEP